jgi:hypothetical protein
MAEFGTFSILGNAHYRSDTRSPDYGEAGYDPQKCNVGVDPRTGQRLILIPNLCWG